MLLTRGALKLQRSARPAPSRALRVRRIAALVRAQAASDQEVYDGMYGQWRVEQEDVNEVLAYRAGLNVMAAALLASAAPAFLPPGAGAALEPLLNPLAAAATGGLGLSLALIHIYVSPIKRTIQALLGLGVAGGLYLASSHPDTPLPLWVWAHPEGVWLVGPAFAALTGTAIKEGLCYGKLEAAVLAALTPTLLLGHLAGLGSWEGAGPGIERALLAAALAACAVFALRKWSQPIKDDIGDKSVFTFQALPPEQQEALVARLKAGQGLEERVGAGGSTRQER